MNDLNTSERHFDQYAENYDVVLDRGLSISGEDHIYFAKMRIAWLRTCLDRLAEKPQVVMDYGCGTGTSLPLLRDQIGAEFVIGLDASAELLERARRAHGSGRTYFTRPQEYRPKGDLDLIFCNGVFHHIPEQSRPGVLEYVHQALRPGGVFAVWENNSWNPGTRFVMRRIPFDRDAIPVSPLEMRRLLSSRGFRLLSTHFLFIFPGFLRRLRAVEPALCRLPLGAQYQVLCRKQ
jgi:SAM-dependent methyltransferase